MTPTISRSAAPSPPSHPNTPKLANKRSMPLTQKTSFLSRPGVILSFYFLLLAIPLSYTTTRLISDLVFYLGYTTVLNSHFGILLHRFLFIGLNLFCLVWWASILEEEEEEKSNHNMKEAISSYGEDNSDPEKALRLQWIKDETAKYEREIERMEAMMKGYRSFHKLPLSSSPSLSSRSSSSPDSRVTSAYEPSLSEVGNEPDEWEEKGKKRGNWEKGLIFRNEKVVKVVGAGGVKREGVAF